MSRTIVPTGERIAHATTQDNTRPPGRRAASQRKRGPRSGRRSKAKHLGPPRSIEQVSVGAPFSGLASTGQCTTPNVAHRLIPPRALSSEGRRPKRDQRSGAPVRSPSIRSVSFSAGFPDQLCELQLDEATRWSSSQSPRARAFRRGDCVISPDVGCGAPPMPGRSVSGAIRCGTSTFCRWIRR
jgi:hypothetical protein